MAQNSKTLGMLLIGFSVLLLFILVFVKLDVDKQSAFLCEKFHENNLDMEQCPAHKSNTSWKILLAFGVAVLVLCIGIYILLLYKSPTAELKRSFKQIDVSKLSEEEKTVYNIIKAKGGSAYQSDLIRETEFSKVKVTRILDKMESMDILDRKRRGMTNIIVLK